MRFLDISYAMPSKNLALDEALLETAASGKCCATLRLWESPVPFVVVGSSQRVEEVVDLENCQSYAMPVLRRCSAGGAVLQGPGCLNYALALSYDTVPEVSSLHASYEYILGKVSDALATLHVSTVREGVSDLAVQGMKCSGNSQRRKKNACLHHGTLLYDMNADDMEDYLIEPEDRPAYRGTRNHAAFVQPLGFHVEQLRAALIRAFCPGAPAVQPFPDEEEAMLLLARNKYSQAEWTFRR
ncbi:MAG TPA: lipoate--protein ligase family protein [Candidatus Hydrogenedentes bacterium]|nr:lipoate--protein ligase family protein [Candidatus Hydrogenedentota bacterium]